jgi:hypothetical protein
MCAETQRSRLLCRFTWGNGSLRSVGEVGNCRAVSWSAHWGANEWSELYILLCIISVCILFIYLFICGLLSYAISQVIGWQLMVMNWKEYWWKLSRFNVRYCLRAAFSLRDWGKLQNGIQYRRNRADILNGASRIRSKLLTTRWRGFS